MHLVCEAGLEHVLQRWQPVLSLPQGLILQEGQGVGSSILLGIRLLAALALKLLLLQHTAHDALVCNDNPAVVCTS